MQTKNVLIVSDDHLTSGFIKKELAKLKYDNIIITSKREEAIEIAQKELPSLVLADAILENNEDGIETAKEIIKLNDAPVVFITSGSDEKAIDRIMKIEPNGFLLKPFDERILKSAIDIATYRHKSKKELFEAKEIFRTTLESIDDIVISLDSEGVVTHVYSKIHDDTKEVLNFKKLNGKKFFEFFPGRIADILNKGFNKLIKTSEPQEFEVGLPIEKPTHYFNIKASLRKDHKEQISGITVVIRDITSKVIWENTLRKFSTAVEQSANVVIIFNKEGYVEFVNNKYIEITKFSYEDNIGRKFQNLNPVKNNKELLEEIWDHLIQGQVWEGEWENQTKDEKTYWESVTISPVRDEQGVLNNFLLISEDITQKKAIQQELLSSRERLEEAQEIAGLGSCEIRFEEQDVKLFYNKMFSFILGIDHQDDDFNEEKLNELIHPDDRQRYKSFKEDVLNNKRDKFSIEYRIIDKNNIFKHIHSLGKVEYADNGQPETIFLTIQDISLQKQSEKLRQDIELARKTADIKQQFFANISHEIRNPLSSIVGLTDLLLKSDLPEEQEQMCKTIMNSADSIMNLINDILDISRIEAGKMKLSTGKFSLFKFFKKVNNTFEPQAKAKGLAYVCNIPGNIPKEIISDENRLMQVVSNLVTNAIKFTNKGFIKIEVSILEKIAEDDYIIKVDVIDTGIGIETKNIPKLFKSFSQINSDIVQNSTGSGLGLSICKHLTDLLGGEIGVYSIPESGSRFWFTFRTLLTEDTSELKEQEEKFDEYIQNIDINDIKGSSVLLVEDKVVNQKVVSLMLEKLGCTVTVAKDGLHAIELFKESQVNAFDIFGKIKYDLILMDVNMPEKDGVEATEYIKKNFRNLPPIIGLTANVTDEDKLKYTKIGMDDVLSKPVKIETLEKKISYWLTLHKNKSMQEELLSIDTTEVEKLPILNPNTLKAISRQTKDSDFDLIDIFESFISDMEDIYNKWLNAIEMNDYHFLKHVVMTVKGLCGNIGASQMYETARKVDRYFKAGQDRKAAAMMPELAMRYEALKQHIKINYSKDPKTQKQNKPDNNKPDDNKSEDNDNK